MPHINALDLIHISGGGVIFGSIYTNNVPIATTLTLANTWYELTDAANPWTQGVLHNCTFATPRIKVLYAGHYLVTWALSTDFSASPGASQQIEYGIMVDGSIQNPGQAHRTLANSTDTGNCAGMAILDLSADAAISLAANNNSSAGKVLHIEHGNLTVHQLGGT
jgi:hypothetical protein